LRPPDVLSDAGALAPLHREAETTVHADFAAHRDDVVNYLRWRVPKSAVDELAQDVFVVAHRRRDEFRGESSMKTWLSGIAFHLVLNWRRSRKRRRRWELAACDVHDEDLVDAVSSCNLATSRDAMDDLMAKELCRRVGRVIGEQPEVARRLWLMVVLEEAPIVHAGKALGLSDHQAHYAFAKVHDRVRRALAREEWVTGTTDGHDLAPQRTER
jgi:RNA polymerase sigma-70 factor (ECF subfamily)